MKKLSLLFLIFLLVFPATAQKSVEPKTITDFFYLLPEENFAPYVEEGQKKPNLRDYRKSLVKISDDKNGYLRLENGNWEGWAEVALFKKTSGKYILGISQVGCGPICSSENKFLAYENESWNDITTEVLPEISDAQLNAAYKRKNINKDDESGLVYELPRVGRVIKVRSDGGKDLVLFELTWDGTKFVLKNK